MTTCALLLCDGTLAPLGTGDQTLIRERIDRCGASTIVNFRADNLDDTALGVVNGQAADQIQIGIYAFAIGQIALRWRHHEASDATSIPGP